MKLQRLAMRLSPNAWELSNEGIVLKIVNMLWKNHKSIEKIDLEAASKLLRHVTSFNEHGDTIIEHLVKFRTQLRPLQTALIQGKIELVESLLINGEKLEGPEWYVDSLVRCAFARENIEIRKDLLMLLLKYGLDTKFHNLEGQNILTIFISYFVIDEDHDVVEIAEILIKSGISVNEIDNEGWTPFSYAIFRENISLVSFLIERGALINYNCEMMQASKKYPLIAAAFSNKKDLMHLLLLNGADVNIKTLDGWTALHEACRTCGVQSIRYLIDNSADINAEDEDGETPFAILDNRWNQYDVCVQIMVKEFSRRIHENLSVSEKNIHMMRKNPKALKYFELCLAEINQMTSTKFYSPHSYYTVFKASKNDLKKLSHLTKNEDFVTKFESNLHKFPFYQNDLQRTFKKATEMRDESLIVESKLYLSFGNLFPDIVIRKLVDNIISEDVLR